MHPTTPTFDILAQALRCPTRRAILAWTEDEWLSVSELARNIGIAVSTCSYHCRELRLAGLVLVERTGRESQVRARFRDHEFIIQRRPVIHQIPVQVEPAEIDDGAIVYVSGASNKLYCYTHPTGWVALS